MSSVGITDFQKSPVKNKKYRVKINNKYYDFGDSRYQHYKDQTPLKLYSHLDHLDEKRRQAFHKRHKNTSVSIWLAKKFLW